MGTTIRNLKVGKADIRLVSEVFDLEDPESIGESAWFFERADVEHFAPVKGDSRYALEQSEEEDETIRVDIADEAIVILAGMIQSGGSYNVGHEANRCGYWQFHDLIHALHDVEDGALDPVEQFMEERALVDGAVLAFTHGEPLADIVRELVIVETDFKVRFSFEYPQFLERFLTQIKGKVIPQ